MYANPLDPYVDNADMKEFSHVLRDTVMMHSHPTCPFFQIPNQSASRQHCPTVKLSAFKLKRRFSFFGA